MSAYETIIVEHLNGVATLTLNRPERLNALNRRLIDEFLDALHSFAEDPDVRAIIITGAGRGFSSGADLRNDGERRQDGHAGFSGRAHLRSGLQQLALTIRETEKPVIAAVNGIAAGGGLDIACSADIRVAAESAAFTEIFARRGLFPGTGGCYFLPRIVGMAKAAELIWLAKDIDAQEALRIGLVSYVFPNTVFRDEVQRFAEQFAAGPPIAIALAKASMHAAEHMDLRSAMNFFATAESITLTSEDRREGLQAFLEKRPAHFVGR